MNELKEIWRDLDRIERVRLAASVLATAAWIGLLFAL